MSYEKQTWATGDIITAEKLNHMEDGIAGAEGLNITPILALNLTTNQSVALDNVLENNHLIGKSCATGSYDIVVCAHNDMYVLLFTGASNAVISNAVNCTLEGEQYDYALLITDADQNASCDLTVQYAID